MSTCQGNRKTVPAGRNGSYSFRGVVGGAACFCAAILMLGGCPTTTPITTDDGDPPSVPSPTDFVVEITSTQGILQLNALGLDTVFQPSSTLAAQVTGPGVSESGFTVDWSIQAPGSGTSVLAFGVGAGTATQATTGASVDVTVVSNPGTDVDQVISATVTLLDSGNVLPIERITIRIIRDRGVDTTVLESNPFATPAVGLDASGQVVLNAGVSGNVRAFAVSWESIADLPSGIALPAPPTGTTLALSVTGPVSGVFSFRCIVQDSSDSVAVGVVNVFLGQAAMTLDVAVTRLNVSPTASSIDIRTTRVGGSDDLSDSTNGPFSYSFQILDDSDQDVTSSAAITPDPSVSDDDAVNDWTISGLSAPGEYRILVTVTDGAERLTGLGSATVALADGLSLALEPQFDRVGAGTGFSIRTVRGGGESNFTYTFETINSAGTAAITTFAPLSGSVDNDVVNTWTLTGFATADTYRIFATVRDGTGNSVTASTEVVVGDVFTLDVKSSDILLAPGDAVTLTFDRTGGTGDFSYAFTETSPGADSGLFGTLSISAAGDGTVTWTAPSAPGAGAIGGVYLIDVIATDARGLSATDSIAILVQADAFSLDTQVIVTRVVPGGAGANLASTFRSGGIAPFSYNWRALDEAGNNDIALFGGQPASAGSEPQLTWSFTSIPAVANAGTYRLECTVTDGDGNTFVSSSEILVSADPLSLDTQVIVTRVVPGGSGANLASTFRTGGMAVFSYNWRALDEAGNNDIALFGGQPTSAGSEPQLTWSFTGVPAVANAGTYRLECTVTDGEGTTFVSSSEILVSADPLSLDTQVIVTRVIPGGSGANLASTFRTGGIATFSYNWRALDESGNNDIALFGGQPTSAGSEPQLVWSFTSVPAVANAGTYRLECTVTDGEGTTFVSSSEILVSADPLSLDTQVIVTRVDPGGSGANLASTFRTGGIAAFSYNWRALDESGNDDIALFGGQPTSAGSEPQLVWSFSSVPAVANAGTYRLECTVTDGEGTTFVSSSEILVSTSGGGGGSLSLDTQVIVTRVIPGGSGANLASTFRTGGIAAFSYNWRALDESGNDDIALFGGQPTSAGSEPELTWSFSSIPAVANAGTYRLECTVTDGEGTTFVSSSEILISADPLSLDTQVIVSRVVPGGSGANLASTFRTGGIATFSYNWRALDESGNDDIALFGGQPTSAGSEPELTWSFASVPGVADAGTYRLECTVTDGEGTTFVSSSEILISADPLSLDTQVIVSRVVPGGSGANLASTFRTGGIATFSYNWRALDESGNDDIALFGGQPTSAGSEPELTWSFSSVPGVADVGTYRLECTVTDGEGTTFVSSSEILIAGDPLSVDVDATSFILAPMMPVRTTTEVFGGTLNFDYAWAATDPQGDAVAAASFSQTTNTNTTSTSEVVDFLPPTNPSGTYRFVAQVTDDNAQVVEQTLHLWVTDDTELVNGDRFDDAADTQDAGELGAAGGDILAAETIIPTGATRMVLEAAALDTATLTHARNLVFLIDDDDNGGELDVTNILITGTNARGDTIQDSFNPANDGFTTANWPFKTITNIALTYSGAEALDSIQIGVGAKFGLSAKFPASTNALHIVATTTPAFIPDTNAITFIDPDSGDLTVATADALDLPTTAQQSLIFVTDVPDNTRDYAVQVGPSNPVISLDVSADDYDLDFSNGDTAVITMDVTGGAAPYTFTYSTVGLTETGSFATGSPQGPFAGDVMDTWTPPNLTALPAEIHALVVVVVDANGDAATAHITIRVQE